jgi:hypothetical protein
MTAVISAPLEDDSMVDDGFADDPRTRRLVLRCIVLERLLVEALPAIHDRDICNMIATALKEGP